MNVELELSKRLLKDLTDGLTRPVCDKKTGNYRWAYLSYQDILRTYCVLNIPRNIFLVQYKKLPPLETIDKEEKTEWKKFVNEIFPGTPPEFRLQAVKIIYTIGMLSNEILE